MLYNFFASTDEIVDLWNWIGAQPGMKLIEASSRPDLSNREFDRFPINEREASVAAWPSSVGGTPQKHFVRFDPNTVARLNGAGMTILESPALIRLSTTGAPNQTLIGPSQVIFETEKLAKKSRRFTDDQIESVDWQSLQIIVTKIKKYIRTSAISTWRSMPVLPRVADQLQSASKKLWFWGDTGTI